jgi:pyrroline-5-carboxylate reductase
MKIAFIGGGNMGEAMLAGILQKRLASPDQVLVSDVKEDRLRYLAQNYGVRITVSNRGAAEGGEAVVLAVKPQNLREVMLDLDGRLRPAQLVLSIIAGAKIATLCQGLKHNRVVRAMPNTPAQIGEGISVWTATREVTNQQRGWASSILGVMGKEIYVADEEYLDMATAVSGSGPAYFFLFVEALVEAAVQIGLSREMARELVLETMLGSGHLIQKSGREPAELRRIVTSPGGTTAEAIAQFEKGDFVNLVKKAVKAAYHKARKLSGEQS